MVEETIPAVTEFAIFKGDPKATTHSPALNSEESPNSIGTNGADRISVILTSAMSVCLSILCTLALNSLPSLKDIITFSLRWTTWAFVAIRPLLSMTNPEPEACPSCPHGPAIRIFMCTRDGLATSTASAIVFGPKGFSYASWALDLASENSYLSQDATLAVKSSFSFNDGCFIRESESAATPDKLTPTRRPLFLKYSLDFIKDCLEFELKERTEKSIRLH
mmetsp:Transcript_8400/g.9588  ORF Transcript_8400/g.9588 Transcript_8400/m.9588 type:complete len:221 (+) Transcript_8400:947-1609(+)